MKRAFSRKAAAVSIVSCVTLAAILLLLALAFLSRSTGQEEEKDPADLIDPAAYVRLMADCVTNLTALVERYRTEQYRFIPILPPDPPSVIQQPCGPVPFEVAGFPEEFTKGLVGVTENGVTVYAVQLAEDAESRDVVFLNSDGTPIYREPAEKGYDPRWRLQLLHPDIDSYEPAQAAWLAALYEPARFRMWVRMIPTEAVVAYLYGAGLAAEEAAKAQGGQMLMMEGADPASNLVFTGITREPEGARLSIGYPDGFAHRLEVLACTNLVESRWWVAATNICTAGSNAVSWLDSDATNHAFVAYVCCDSEHDTDGDSLPDGEELYVFGTGTNTVDTDNDGLQDGAEVKTYGTNPLNADTDGDGVGDGAEVTAGTDPLNPHDPPNVLGVISYAGRQTGAIWVVAVTNAESWETNHACALSAPGPYQIPNLLNTNYWLKAFLDADGSGGPGSTEAWGAWTNNPLVITNRVLGRNIVLSDPDLDGDGLPDWWEVAYFGNTNTAGSADTDEDGHSDLEEYDVDTNPTNAASHPVRISGTVTYVGFQTGMIWVAASLSSSSWAGVRSVQIATPGSYAIAVKPGTSYWLRAWRDADGDGAVAASEAQGQYASNPVCPTGTVTGVNIVLADPDSDGDGLPDWWETQYGFDAGRGGGATASAWWKLDETSGTNVSDATTHGNNGLLVNAGESAWTRGLLDNALALNGAAAHVEIPDSASLRPLYVSVSLWLNPGCGYTSGCAVFLSKKEPEAPQGYALGYENGALTFTICASGSKVLSRACSLPQNQWMHVAGVYSGSWQGLYTNGVLTAETNSGTSIIRIDQTNTVLRLGASSDAIPTNCFLGRFDDVRVYGGALASNDVHAIYEIGADPDGDGVANLTEYRQGRDPRAGSNPEQNGSLQLRTYTRLE